MGKSEGAATQSGESGLSAWPPHGKESQPWQQTVRGGTREDRTLRVVETSLPPLIGDRQVWVPPALSSRIEDALREIIALDTAHAGQLEALGTTLLRTESVASSKIESVEADITEYARALHGTRTNPSAVSMVAATTALRELIESVNEGVDVTLGSILRSHEALMRDDPHEAGYAGRIRDVQNWIGGSDYSPRNALFVPPPPDTVTGYLEDLIAFTNRNDLSAMVQAAVAHAQFESIHPFTDGNGRIGRALVNTVLRRRGVTRRVVVPLASALVARREAYFDVLTQYREGDPAAIIEAFARASSVAARESRVTAQRIAELPQRWRDAAGRVRAGSATARLLEHFLETPVFSAEEAELMVGGATSAVYKAVERLVEAGVLRPLTQRRRNQVWGVADMLDELEDLSMRIGVAARQL